MITFGSSAHSLCYKNTEHVMSNTHNTTQTIIVLTFFRQGYGAGDCSPTPRASAPPTVVGRESYKRPLGCHCGVHKMQHSATGLQRGRMKVIRNCSHSLPLSLWHSLALFPSLALKVRSRAPSLYLRLSRSLSLRGVADLSGFPGFKFRLICLLSGLKGVSRLHACGAATWQARDGKSGKKKQHQATAVKSQMPSA